MKRTELSDFEKIILDTVRSGMNDAIKNRLMDNYNSPVKLLIDDAFKVHEETIRGILYSALSKSLATNDFKKSVKEAFDHKIARAMIDKMTGIVDKAVDTIKQDPTIKARMVLAIQNIVEEFNQTSNTKEEGEK